jgi:uncharacterized protein DUF4128
MSLGPAKTAIRAYIEAGFTAAPLLWPNERHSDTATPQSFVAVEVKGATNNIRGIGLPGSRLFIHGGVIMAHVFVPFGVGQATGDDLADAIALLLTRKDIPAPSGVQVVRTEDPSTYDGELSDEDGNYWRISVSVPFDFYYSG